METETNALTLVEFTEDDVTKAKAIAATLGYHECAYTSSGVLPGLQCLATADRRTSGAIIKTREVGFLFVQHGEDLNLGIDFEDVTEEVVR